MPNFKDLLVEGSTYEISLTKLTGLKIKDIYCNITREFGDPVVEINHIVFEDGSELSCEGEHDLAYVTCYYKRDLPNMDEDTLLDLWKQENGSDEEENDE